MVAQVAIDEGVTDMLSQILNFIPLFVAFLLILVVGYFIAKGIAKLLNRALEKFGFDRAVDRGGIGSAMERTEYDPSDIVGKIIFYTLMLFVLQLAFGIFGENPVSDLIFAVIAFLPRLFVAILIVVVAAALANAARDTVRGVIGGLSYGRAVANLAGGAILVIGVFAALNQLQIAPQIVNGLFYALLAIVAGSAIIAIGGGGIAPMRSRWERALSRAEEEAPRFRDEAQGPADATSGRAELRRHASGGSTAVGREDTTIASVSELSSDQLYDLAKERGIEGRSNMSRDELVAALRHHEGAGDGTIAVTSYSELTVSQLRGLAQERDIEGRSDMSREELVKALRQSDRTQAQR